MRRDLEQEYEAIRFEESNLEAKKQNLNTTVSEIQDKRADREKKKMELFFLKKQVADETARLKELKSFLDQNP